MNHQHEKINEYDPKLLKKIEALSTVIRPKEAYLKAILEELPADTRAVPSPFISFFFKFSGVVVAGLLVFGLLGYVGINAMRHSGTVAYRDDGKTVTSIVDFTALENALSGTAEENNVAFADETAPYAQADTTTVEAISNVYTNYDY